MNDQDLRYRLVDRLKRSGVLTDERVAQALLRVPRERFIPSVSLEDAYDDRAIVVKEAQGQILSSISQPSMIVQMLQMLDVAERDSVLEIGTGTGYHAALLGELVGAHGHVTTVDIEPDLIESAVTRLNDLGYEQIHVADASALADVHRPFDRIVVTARATDIDPAWWRLLRDGGRIVVPLQIGYGAERAFGFIRKDAALRSFASHRCAFISIRAGSESAAGETFFPNPQARYQTPELADKEFSVVAVQRADATPELMEGADIIVARPNTIFALRTLRSG